MRKTSGIEIGKMRGQMKENWKLNDQLGINLHK
jgi:hypothetical protein